MAIYRGIGGAGDSNTDATVTAVTEQATNAQTSANNAATSANSAATSASAASSSATSAATSATSAATQVSLATTQANNAATSAAESAASATASQSSSVSAQASQTAAEAAKVGAETARTGAETAETNANASASQAAASVTSAATYATNSANSATASQTSADNSASSASQAASSASASASSASAAAASATAASGSATAAATSATQAASSAASAAALLDNFDDRYLGAKTSDPALDNDGNPLVVGAIYFNTTDGVMKVYTASGWIEASSTQIATMVKYYYTATNGQTVFSGLDDNSETLSLTVGAEMVSLNGVLLESGADYTATTSSVTLTSGAATGDELTVFAFGNFSVADTVSKSTGGTFDGAVEFAAGATFGDNDKAIFGAGSDLQIYHNGTNSYIDDAGSGTLRIRASSATYLQNYGGTETYAGFIENGACTLNYDNAQKLATTATGIDVTGTATMDGLTVDGNAQINGTNAGQLTIDATGQYTQILMEQNGVANSGGDLIYDHTNDVMQLRSLAVGGVVLKTSPTIGNPRSRLDIASNGDISFYEDTGTTAKFFWDASAESLGIGTSSPAETLVLNKAANNNLLRFDLAGVAKGYIGTSSISGGVLTGTSAGDLSIRSEAGLNLGAGGSSNIDMRIDSAGNVGIGTSSPLVPLHVTTSATGTTAGSNVVQTIRSGAAGRDASLQFSDTSASAWIGALAGNIHFGNSSVERMRLDSSGNLLVGTTDDLPVANNDASGIALRNDGNAQFSRSGAATARFNRGTNDGEIVSFSKDGTTVGSIGTDANSELYISGAGNRGGIGFYDTATGAAIQPVNSDGTVSNGDTDIGSSSARFKDLYLSGNIQMGHGYNFSWGGSYASNFPTIYATSNSGGYIDLAPNGNATSLPVRITDGGIHLGGTGAANKLDDYEEGTWTPSGLSLVNCSAVTSSDCKYIKVGGQVTITGRFDLTVTSASSEIRITFSGPFNQGSSYTTHVGSAWGTMGYNQNNRAIGYIADNTGSNNYQWALVIPSTEVQDTGVGKSITFSLTYFSSF